MRFRLIYIHIRYIIIHIRRQIICLKYINTYPEHEQRYLPEIFRGEIKLQYCKQCRGSHYNRQYTAAKPGRI